MAKTSLNAFFGKIIVVPEKVGDTFKDSKIVKPDIIKSKELKAADHGIVKEVGSDIEDIKPGYEIWFEQHSGTFINIDGQDVLVINYTDGLCYKEN